ncbi:hypothetical protein C8R42DRAFT_643544 [Lentinula raphanica]|nr:hypothetical protein C8R42DRAFT_643544 [Lentinula raphanica]
MLLVLLQEQVMTLMLLSGAGSMESSASASLHRHHWGLLLSSALRERLYLLLVILLVLRRDHSWSLPLRLTLGSRCFAQLAVLRAGRNTFSRRSPQCMGRSVEPMEVDRVAASGGRAHSYAFLDPRTAKFLAADPAGMLTSVNPVVSKVLSEGWSEPIPLGHFARCFNPLLAGGASGDLSMLRMGENGQVQVHHRRLRDIPLDDLTESDWYQIKCNFPRVVKEFLIPPGEKHVGSKVAQASADMIHNLFTMMEECDRFLKEITPIFYYVDHKIRWWRAHSMDNICIDSMDKETFESIYREWREREDKREKEKERLFAREKFEKFSGGRSGPLGQGFSSHFGGGGGHASSSHHGPKQGRGFADHHGAGGGGSRSFRCIICGQPDHDSRRHQAAASDYLKRDSDGIYRDSAGKWVCFSWNGTRGCDFKPCHKGEHWCGICDFPITTRLKAEEWVRVLGEAGVLDQFGDVLEGIASGFDIGVDHLSILHMVIPSNHFKTEAEAHRIQ